MQLTDRINRIQISPTAAVISAAEQLKSKGVDIADFGPGEPDFPTPDHIKKAAIRAIEENRSKYTPTGGIMPLREAIAGVAQTRTGIRLFGEGMRGDGWRQAFDLQQYFCARSRTATK